MNYLGRSPWQHTADASRNPETAKSRRAAMVQVWSVWGAGRMCSSGPAALLCMTVNITAVISRGNCIIWFWFWGLCKLILWKLGYWPNREAQIVYLIRAGAVKSDCLGSNSSLATDEPCKLLGAAVPPPAELIFCQDGTALSDRVNVRGSAQCLSHEKYSKN